MSAPRGWQRIISRIAAAAKGLAVKVRLGRAGEPIPAMIGTPPSARFPAIPADPAVHAARTAHEWADVAETYVQQRMRRLGIPERQIGVRRRERNYRRIAFIPSEGDGGGITPDGINVDSGVLNPQLDAEEIGPRASAIWARARLRDRIDAVIAHEYEESRAGTHEGAEMRAADTALPISDTARRILRARADRENQGGRR
jgi:hypothetical protein